MKVRPGNKAGPPTGASRPQPPTPEPGATSLGQRQRDQYAAGPRPPPPSGGRTTALRGVEVSAAVPSDTAEAEAASVVRAMTQRPDIQKKLRAAKVELVIIPQGQMMTALPQFASLHGKSTFDGRQWDDVRGVGGTLTPDGKMAVGIPEENLSNLPGDTYDGNYSVATHELAHVIHDLALSVTEKVEIDAAYEARKSAGGPWTEAYSSSNSHEYFAQATNAYFGRNGGMGHNGKAWLQKNDPEIFALLQKVYVKPGVP